MRPSSAAILVVVGVAAWTVVTAAALIEVVQAPAEHLDLALGILLIWVVLIVFAAFSRVTEAIGRGPH